MNARNVSFFQGVATADRITIFVPPGEFDADPIGVTYGAELFPTEHALVLRVQSPGMPFLATNPEFYEEMLSGQKEVWIAHLHPQLGYVLDQARLRIPRPS